MTRRWGWRMAGRGRLERFEDELGPAPPGWVTIEVAGCGVCHTDLGYLYDGVPTAAKGDLVLGHEVVGRLDGAEVIVPAVSPCGECPSCRRGRPTACRAGLMPGNHHDGGFASHVQVPGRWLCPVPQRAGLELWQLAAVADAVTTPLQAIRRARLGAGEIAIVVGAGGVGGFLVELAAAVAARVFVVDVAADRRARALARGARAALDPAGRDPRAVKQELVQLAGDADGWHVFECSGAAAGQTLAFQLLTRGATLSVVGFSPEAVPLKLSALMALDAEAYGNWGCDPVLYPEALRFVLDGRIDLAGAVERFPLADAPAVLEAAHQRRLGRRAVLVP